MIYIDGRRYDVRCDIERKAELTASDISGLLMDKTYFNDVLGTYLSYDLAFKYPLRDQNKYAALFEALTAPVDGHLFILPYNGTTVTITARVAEVSDRRIEPIGGAPYWKETHFTITANHPTRTLSLGEAITRGRAPLPEAADPAEGDSYTWHDGEWVQAEQYADADAIAY